METWPFFTTFNKLHDAWDFEWKHWSCFKLSSGVSLLYTMFYLEVVQKKVALFKETPKSRRGGKESCPIGKAMMQRGKRRQIVPFWNMKLVELCLIWRQCLKRIIPLSVLRQMFQIFGVFDLKSENWTWKYFCEKWNPFFRNRFVKWISFKYCVILMMNALVFVSLFYLFVSVCVKWLIDDLCSFMSDRTCCIQYDFVWQLGNTILKFQIFMLYKYHFFWMSACTLLPWII